MSSPTVPCALRERDAAAYVGVTTHALRRWRQRGVGPAYARLGRAIVYRVADMDEWIEARLIRPHTAA